MNRLLVIDGYSIINRAFYGIPMLNNRDGVPTNAIYGFLNIMFKTLEMEEFTHMAVAFDVKKPTFRHEMYEQYKGTRKPMPEELTCQVPLLKELLKAMNITCLELSGYEADDILGTCARRFEAEDFEVRILSGDRDLLQIATKRTKIIIPKTKAGKTETFVYDEDGVVELYGVTPTQFIDMKALMGDTSDNIPGLPGVGEKTAGALIAKYGSIEECYAHVDEIKPAKAKAAFEEHYDLAVISKKLARINTEAPIEIKADELIIKSFANPESFRIVQGYNFKSMLNKFKSETGDEELKKEVSFPTLTEVSDLMTATNIFEEALELLKAGKNVSVGTAFYGDLYGTAIILSDDKCYYIPAFGFTNGEWQKDQLHALIKNGVIVLNARNIYDLLTADDRFDIYDIRDVHIMSYLLEPLSSNYGYSEIGYKALGVNLPSEKELFDKKFNPESEDGMDILKNYAFNNAYVAYKAYSILKEELTDKGMYELYKDIELPLSGALYRCEQRGIIARRDELIAYGEKLSDGIFALEKKIYEGAGQEFNINSPKQLGEILFEKLKLPGGKKTKTGYSTSAEVLEGLASEYPFVAYILEYRQLSKLKSTYADSLADYIGDDGRIHCRFHQTVTATGRISCSDPNLQNIPVRMALGREIRKLFVPGNGCVFVDADYSQIELRVLAHMSGDENLLKAYEGASDIHAATAAAVFHVPLDEVTPELRRKAKAVNFGIVYGISSFGLSGDINVTKKEAAEIIERYFESYPGVKSFLDKQVDFAKKHGYVRTMFNRIRPIPELKATQYMQRMFGERVAMNSPIQGTAADIMKLAMLRTEAELIRRNLKSHIVLQVHDELLLECPENEADEVKELLKTCMSDSFALKVYLDISISEGKSWYETK